MHHACVACAACMCPSIMLEWAKTFMLDQFTRNMHRGTAQAWSGDAKALKVCMSALKMNHDASLPPIAVAQLMMPLVLLGEHG